jgi:hypothetical protein
VPRSQVHRSSEASSEECFDRRSEIIRLARYGKISPEEAEAEAASMGWKPFALQAEMPALDPMRESRWTITMAVAWIAWRDLDLVRNNSFKFPGECWHWLFREWNESNNSETDELTPQAGWFLESWSEPTTIRLLILEHGFERRSDLPSTARLPVAEAERELWEALGDERLAAAALDSNGRPVEVPAREWSYLKLFEDGKRDVLKYDAHDRGCPYTGVKLKRDDLLRLWPATPPAQAQPTSHVVEPQMLEPVTKPGREGLVPLCAAVHWIMTQCGTVRVTLDDLRAWDDACEKLVPFIVSGEISLIGTPPGDGLSEHIPGHALATVKILPPLMASISDICLNAPSHIACSNYLGRDNWRQHFNDRLYKSGQARPAWTHLQVSKSAILSRWSLPTPTNQWQQACRRWLITQMKESSSARPKPKAAFWAEAKGKFKPISKRQFLRAWDEAIETSGSIAWSRGGRPPQKSNRRSN